MERMVQAVYCDHQLCQWREFDHDTVIVRIGARIGCGGVRARAAGESSREKELHLGDALGGQTQLGPLQPHEQEFDGKGDPGVK